jgi:class 3 adenylate cyclase/succinate dehydrogenase hydrophobic anchor subunit
MADDVARSLQDELALARWSLRFARPETEADYRAWHARQAMPFMRITYLSTIFLAFPGMLIGTRSVAPQVFLPVAAWVLLVLAPIAVAGFFCTWREWMVRWHGPVSAFSNAFIAGSLVFILFFAVDRPDLATMATIAGAFFAFGALRMHPGQALVSALPYYALTEVVLAVSRPADLVPYSAVTLITFGGGLIVAWTLDRTSRESYRQRRIIQEQQRTIERERDRADEVLYNVLPAAIADKLKLDPARIAEHFNEVTVLFGDIAGFTPMSAEMSPQDLVATLDEVFTAFDDIAQRHGLEKIKTIGDAYMAVGGAPTPRADHAQAVARMALEMRDLVAQRRFFGTRQLQMRIGIHTGPAVAGVIGRKKFIYDLWGDTVNTASRMESHGAPGEIQLTDATRAALGNGWMFEERGVSEIKGKGPMRTWWLKGLAATSHVG